ncbi:hypothetical protein D3C80_1947080 [compost metagenome]
MKPQHVIDFFYQHKTVNGELVFPQPLDTGAFMVELILDFADNLFHDILQCNHAGSAAILINEDSNLCLGPLHHL